MKLSDLWNVSKAFLESFLCLTKRMEKFLRGLIGLYEAAAAVRSWSFAETRSILTKVLIVAVRSCHCGALFRGLQNLEAPQKGTFLVLFACTKRTKSTPEVCEPLDSGDDSKLCRK